MQYLKDMKQSFREMVLFLSRKYVKFVEMNFGAHIISVNVLYALIIVAY